MFGHYSASDGSRVDGADKGVTDIMKYQAFDLGDKDASAIQIVITMIFLEFLSLIQTDCSFVKLI